MRAANFAYYYVHMTRACLIHIGLHKTGTTAIQKALGTNRAKLLAQGILYPEVPGHEAKARGQHGLGVALGLSDSRIPGHFGLDDLIHHLETTRADRVVLSTETLSVPRIAPERITGFLDMIRARGFAPTVVAFVRPQAPLINSSYVQQTQTFQKDEPIEAYVAHGLRTAYYDMTARLAAWTDQPGVRFVAVPYTTDVQGPRIAEALLAAGGVERARIEAAGMAAAETANASAGAIAVAAFRFLTRRNPELSNHPRRARLQAAALAAAEARGWNRERFVGLDQADVDRLKAHFAASNEAFAARHWGRSWSDVFASEDARPWRRNDIDPARLPAGLHREFEDFERECLARSVEIARPRGLAQRVGRLLATARA